MHDLPSTPTPPTTTAIPPFWLLAAVTMTGTAALHIFVPALPDIARHFEVSRHTAQYAITLYLVGMAFGQLVYGPLSDRFGRRPLLVCGLSLYLAGLLLGCLATGIGALLAARVLQSLGGCGALVLGRAMVRDVSGRLDAARQLATLGLVMGLTPAVAPAVGGLIDGWLGWRAIFAALALVVSALLVLVLRRLPETNRAPVPLPGVSAILLGYWTLWRSPTYRRFTIAGACAATSLYAFLAQAPFLLVEIMRQSPASVGFYCLLAVAGMMLGTLLARQMAARAAPATAARRGNLLCLASAGLLVLLSLSHQLGLAAMMTLLVLYAVGIGIVSPNALAGLMNTHPERAGAASSLYGFLQMAFGAGFTWAVSLGLGGPETAVALVLLGAASCAGASLQRV
ncbi:multidrug effflux MFS transporter [Lichenicoccus sp.]|uniref:multidrug effflux MFS transporter n=1 Tax=Lichenicoccus sp. TaxID=2781899 RepID=UPI003D0C1276